MTEIACTEKFLVESDRVIGSFIRIESKRGYANNALHITRSIYRLAIRVNLYLTFTVLLFVISRNNISH